MLTAKLMEPAANALEGLQVATLEEGRIHANVFRFSGVPGYGFRLWRWTKFRDGWKRSQLFQAGDISNLSLLLGQLEELTNVSESASDPKPVSLELREYALDNLVETFTNGSSQALISDPQKPKPVEPFFVLRRRVGDSKLTANWFYTSDIADLQKSLDEVHRWYQESAIA